ncbi:MAG: phosphate starvation-inducible protein PhoH, partial [Solirubrobacteraceae bacterium]|nr:phosphate starvation-inducible protein PhoH [Solirubrobacteraceae bacterium]
MRTQLELTNDVASELAGPGDAIMKTLEGELDCDVFLRGNVVTLDGGEREVETAATVIREISDLVQQG